MALPVLADYFKARKGLPFPLASTDPDLFLDLDFTTGQTAINNILVTREGLAYISGGLWDSVKGFNSNGVGRWYKSGWTPALLGSRAAIGNNWSIHMEIERAGIGASYLDNSSNFIDSTSGITTTIPFTTSQNYGVLALEDTASPNPFLQIYTNRISASSSVFRLDFHDTVTNLTNTHNINPDYLSYEDSFLSLDIVMENGRLQQYMDGMLVFDGVWGSANAAYNMFALLVIGDTLVGGRGQAYIRRMQFVKRAVKNSLIEGPKVGIVGDSFCQRSTNFFTFTTPTVALINAAEFTINDSTLNTVSSNNPSSTYNNYCPWGLSLRKLAALNAVRFPLFNAGDGGHGWSSTANGGTTLFRPAFAQALNAWGPEIIIALGSINDLSTTSPPVNLIGETETGLDILIDGNPNLKKILFFQTFPGWKGNGDVVTDAIVQQYKSQIAAQADPTTGLDGYRGIVDFYPTYANLGGDNYDVRQNGGSHPAAPLWDAAYGRSETYHDAHPGQWGMNRMAELIWPIFSQYILQLPTD